MKIQRFLIVGLLIQLLFLYGCGTSFMTKQQVSKYDIEKGDEHTFILYKKDYDINNRFELTERDHFLFKVGANLNSIPNLFYVYDTSMMELLDFGARIIKPDGSTTNYSEGDLQTLNMTSRKIVSELYMKFIPGLKQITKGDIIEVYYSHKYALPQLGIDFYMDEFEFPVKKFNLSITAPQNINLDYKTVNNFPEPVISDSGNSKHYSFNLKDYRRNNHVSIMGKKNSEPGVLISVPLNPGKKLSWKEFGDWYLNLIDSKLKGGIRIEALATEITRDLKDPKDKMDAIFNYCQKNIRYEQVYLKRGEVIPNQCNVILERKYGDCKDYATIIYAMGKSIGLDPHLALCYRGRGNEFYKDIAVSQFNHMIVYYAQDGKDYWYDGTNRIGIPGITTADLINQDALVLIKGGSVIKNIGINDSNLLKISGDLKPINKNLEGSLNIDLYNQYAIDFFYITLHLNQIKIDEYILNWIKHNLNESIIVHNLKWSEKKRRFHIKLDCEIPNALLNIANNSMISIVRVFPDLFPSPEVKDEEIFYYPGYSDVRCDVLIDGLSEESSAENYDLSCNFNLSPGPFNEKEKQIFLKNYRNINNKLSSLVKLKKAVQNEP